MQRFVPLAILLACAVTAPLRAQPAAAATDALACLFAGVTPEQRALAGAAASQRLTDVPADGERRGGAALDSILAALPRCAEAGRWTEARRDMAHQYVLLQTAREDVRRRYAAQNVDLSFIDDAIVAMPARASPSFDSLVARVRAQGVGDDRSDSAGEIVFIYLELSMNAEAIRAGFADPGFRLR